MKSVSFENVALGGFWKKRFEINKNSTIPMVYDRFSDTGRFDAFKFDWRKASPTDPTFSGIPTLQNGLKPLLIQSQSAPTKIWRQ